MKNTRTLMTIAAAAALASGCATQQQTETAVGTGAGAAAGAVLGTMIGGSGRGTVVGAAVGAGVGAAAGYNWPLVKEKLGMATKDSGVAVSEQKDGSLKVSVPGSVSFASGSAAIETRLYPTLDKLANTLNEYPASAITVVGYTDSQGSTQDNLELSGRRAAAVADYLALRGVQRNRMTITGRGEAEPIADNATETGRAQNRRVEMVIRQPQG
ncbi:MAG: OmpA family protein [Gammaproteobacteria bacterium]|nr:OmpA family protein [Rhodocyclaceae bacterium]MBU3909009.1 OmpA family protein [Gammaproteobacteria bacterium]MBU3989977.1 OmpA family protein [Gammaproteobacteria bacterium]MBU4003766.1 OmpA family protein [Gammaproteobacteria bacterium]MBU4021644.1 OmpA family protein [Gammaproteobacteria bacterium]